MTLADCYILNKLIFREYAYNEINLIESYMIILLYHVSDINIVYIWIQNENDV